MTDSTKISTLMDDARECCEQQPDTMMEKTASSTQEQQSLRSPESTVNGVAATNTSTTPSATTNPPSSTSPVLKEEDSSSSKRPEEDGKQQHQQASQASNTDATKEAASAVSHGALVLTQLARQLEYYFSRQNLAKDTYVQTLRKLNSGCVPVAILANFSKVKLLLLSMSTEEERVKAVLQACTQHSEGRLRVVSIDTGSGKIVPDETTRPGANTILAIGTHDNEPLTISADVSTVISASSPTASKSVVFLPSSPMGGSVGATNTLILRDVIPQVTEQEIQALFTFEGCSSVESIHQDVGNCWFVRLDTEDRLVMAQTMMHVQTLTLAGYPVHARLKASLTSTVCVDTAPPMPALTGAWVPDKAKKSKRKKTRGRKKKSNSNSTININESSGGKEDSKDSKNSDINNSNTVVSPAISSSSSPSVIPPSLDEDNFPTLHDKKVEWETISEQGSSSKGDNPDEDKDREDDDDYEEEEEEEGGEEGINDEGEEDQRRSSSSYSKAFFSSDGASTATTTSSSTESFSKKTTLVFPAVGGYAAALMTTPGLNRQQPVGTTSSTLATDQSKPQEMRSSATGAVQGGASDVDDEITAATAAGGPPPMVVQPASWGQGRSFADILRKD